MVFFGLRKEGELEVQVLAMPLVVRAGEVRR